MSDRATMSIVKAKRWASWQIARIARLAVYRRFGSTSADADIVTDYLEAHPAPDWRGAWGAYRAFSRKGE